MAENTVTTEPITAETETKKLQTQHWGEVDIDEETYETLLDLYKYGGGIASIVKIAAHIGKVDTVDWFASSSQEGLPGNLGLARKLFQDLCDLVTKAEKFDAEVDQELDKHGL